MTTRKTLDVLLFSTVIWVLSLPLQAQESLYIILRRPILNAPPNCYEFLLVDSLRPDGRQRAWFAPSLQNPPGIYLVGEQAFREGWQVDPVAHPAGSVPFERWEAADYAMTVLSRFAGDFYECLGPRTMQMPARVLPPAPPAGTGIAPRYCVLRKADLYQPGPPGSPPVCFEFYLADLTRTIGALAGLAADGRCATTVLASRQGYQVDPNLGGPYRTWIEGDWAMSRLSRYQGDFYGCLAQPPALDRPPDRQGPRGADPGPGAPPGQRDLSKCFSADGRHRLCREHNCYIPEIKQNVCYSNDGRHQMCRNNGCQPQPPCYWEETVVQAGVPCYWEED